MLRPLYSRRHKLRIDRIVRQNFCAVMRDSQQMLQLYRIVIDLERDNHVFFEGDHVFFRIATAQPWRFINT